MSMGKRLKSLREGSKLTMVDLAKLAGLTVSQVSNYENDHSTPTTKVLIKLANHLDTTTDYIVRGKQTQNLLEGLPLGERKLVLDYIDLLKTALKYRKLTRDSFIK